MWAKSSENAILGGDAIGELRKPSEVVGREAAGNLFAEVESGATVDVHLVDMLIPYVSLADGNSIFLTHSITDHIDTNICLVRQILGIDFRIEKLGKLYSIEKT